MSDPICNGGGWIVGMDERLPADPSDYYSEEGMLVGCNRIKCRKCGAMVRHFDRAAAKAITLGEKENARLYLSEKPFKEFDFMYRNRDSRTYACKCSIAKTMGGRPLDNVEPNWYCAGHPQG
jgi:hypothetical protein